MRTVVLHGWLSKKFGKMYKLDVRSPAEAIRALCVQMPGMQKQLAQDKFGFRVHTQDFGYDKETLQYPFGEKEALHIVPVISGAKEGIGQILLGAVLLVAAFWAAGTSLAGMSLFGTSVTFGQALTTMGLSLFLGGISQVLFAPPKAQAPQELPENKPSYAFNGPVNTVRQGNAVPVAYGELVVGTQVVSAGFYAEDIAV